MAAGASVLDLRILLKECADQEASEHLDPDQENHRRKIQSSDIRHSAPYALQGRFGDLSDELCERVGGSDLHPSHNSRGQNDEGIEIEEAYKQQHFVMIARSARRSDSFCLEVPSLIFGAPMSV